MASAPDETDDRRQVAAWAASGAMALTGRADGAPLGPPAGLVPELARIARVLSERSGELGRRVDVDPLALLGERAAIAGLQRQGPTSCGGGTRLLASRDGWVAVSLARPDDVDLVPAWLQIEPPSDLWPSVVEAVGQRSAVELVERGVLLGLPVAALGETDPPPLTGAPQAPLPLRRTLLGTSVPRRSLQGLRVVDLSSLWAGPLCGSLLAAAGADVVKVESTHRPDGARSGPAAFFDLVNVGKRSVALDLHTEHGRRELDALLRAADVVIEASRPRALAQLGIDAAAVLASGRTAVWLSITGHGRAAAPARVAFGDDAAVAGGLVAWDGPDPCFCADAAADPVTGLVAAAAVVDALAAGDRWLLDVSLAGVAAHLAGPTLPVGTGIVAAPPSARIPAARGPRLGEHTAAVLSELARA